jgi:hypothetical protein
MTGIDSNKILAGENLVESEIYFLNLLINFAGYGIF